MDSIFLVLCSGLFAVAVSLAFSTLVDNIRIKKAYKMQVFKDILAYRGDITENTETVTGGFEQAINQVFVAFNDSKKVLEAFNDYRVAVNSASIDHLGKLVTLMKSMADDLHISYSFANDDLFLNPLKVHRPK